MSSGDEVSVSVGQMVMMKTEDQGDPGDPDDPDDPGDPDDPDDPNKNQVILQLQPITGNEAETDAAVMTVESHAETPCLEGDDVEIGYPITCGDSKALLLAKKFVCPGINVKCVKVDDQLISPKQFVHMSGKATLKDWKRAIRMGGVMLRKMMDSGQLDFYHHTSLCTNTCRSTKFDLLINNTRFPPDGTGTETTPTSCPVVAGGNISQTDAGSMEWSSTVPLEAAEKKDACDISEETLSFWKGIADVGLMGEVVTNISTELLQLLTGVQLRTEQPNPGQDSECLVEVAVLSNLAQVFGLLDSVKKILERRKLQINPGQEDFLSTLNSLEEQLEEQSRQQQVRAELSSNPQPVVKNKPTANKRQQTKRPRLQRPASTTALLNQQVALQTQQQQQQFTVLSPISLSSMGQAFTSMGQSFTSMGQTYTLVQQPQVFTLHPSSGLTLVDPTMTSMTLVDPTMTSMTLVDPTMTSMELVQLSQQNEAQVMDGTVLVHQEVMSEGQTEAGQEHTVIQIDPAPMGGGGVKEELHQDGLEMTVEEAEGRGGQEEVQEIQEEQQESHDQEEQEIQEVQEENMHTEEVQGHQEIQEIQEVQGLTLDASGHISGVQIVVMEESSVVPNP